MTHYMLTKLLPFKQLHDLLAYAHGSTFPTASLSEHMVTSDGLHFIRSLLAADPEDRFTVQVALQCAWLGGRIQPASIEERQVQNGNATSPGNPLTQNAESQGQPAHGAYMTLGSSEYSRGSFESNGWRIREVTEDALGGATLVGTCVDELQSALEVPDNRDGRPTLLTENLTIPRPSTPTQLESPVYESSEDSQSPISDAICWPEEKEEASSFIQRNYKLDRLGLATYGRGKQALNPSDLQTISSLYMEAKTLL
ncbi:hypothetical protein BJY01DRAFT_255518 [Aspergillus pseudoustus]|uniref:Protein kinase domain-containing protein n=1 Tax=Aspergillus pseudoustus TaxID=1810923 RepID=A0ABR4IJK6_9EURO